MNKEDKGFPCDGGTGQLNIFRPSQFFLRRRGNGIEDNVISLIGQAFKSPDGIVEFNAGIPIFPRIESRADGGIERVGGFRSVKYGIGMASLAGKEFQSGRLG